MASSYIEELQKWREKVRERTIILQMQQQQRLMMDDDPAITTADDVHENQKEDYHTENDVCPNNSETRSMADDSLPQTQFFAQSVEDVSDSNNNSPDLDSQSHKKMLDWKSFEETPIKSAISGLGTSSAISFEDHVENQLKTFKMAPESASSKPKQPFLRKRSGLSRFSSTGRQKSAAVNSPMGTPRSTRSRLKPPPVNKEPARKTKKVSMPPRTTVSRRQSPRNVDATSRSRQTPELRAQKGPNSLEKDGNRLQQKLQPSASEACCYQNSVVPDPEDKHQLEKLQLAEFELLEEVADNASFDSSSSFMQSVLNSSPGLLGQKQALVFEEEEGRLIPDDDDAYNTQQNRLQTLQMLFASLEQEGNMLHDLQPSPDYMCHTNGHRAISGFSLDVSDDEEEKAIPVQKPCISLDSVPRRREDDGKCVRYNDTVEVHEFSVEEDSQASTIDHEKDEEDAASLYSPTHLDGDAQNAYLSLRHHILQDHHSKDLHSETRSIENYAAAQVQSERPEYQDITVAVKPPEMVTVPSASPLKARMQELDDLLTEFRADKQKLTKLWQEYEEASRHLRLKNDLLEKQQKELDDLRMKLEEEQEAFRKEKRLCEKYKKSSTGCPSKEDHEKIAILKEEVSRLKQQLEEQQKKALSESKHLKSRNSFLERDQKSLKAQVKELEQQKQDLTSKLNALKKKISNMTPKLQKQKPVSQMQLIVHSTPAAASKAGEGAKPNKSILKNSSMNENNQCIRQQEHEAAEDGESSTALPVSPLWLALTQYKETKNSKAKVHFDLAQEDEAQYDSEKENVPEKEAGEEGETGLERPLEEQCNNNQQVVLKNGTRTYFSADGRCVSVYYYNGDVKKVFEDKTEVIYYAESNVTVTTYPDGLKIIEFANGQIERHHSSGMKHITFPNGSIVIVDPDGSRETHLPDGTITRVLSNGQEILQFPNGQKEIRAKEYKRKEYPNGTVKTLYADGRQETKYASGRMRLKDKEGNLIADYKI